MRSLVLLNVSRHLCASVPLCLGVSESVYAAVHIVRAAA